MMDESDIKERAKHEQDRMNAILEDAKISQRRMDALQPVIENTAWMKAKLDDARAAIKTAQIVVTYNNGGGQKGIRENPLFKGYESLWKSYMTGMSKILDCLPNEVAATAEEYIEKPKTVLDLVRSKHEQVAI